jgi:hypothetical protein
MDMKTLAVLFVVLCSIAPVHAADLNPQDAGAGMIQKGFDLVITSLADSISYLWQGNTLSQAYANNTNVTDKYGSTRSAIMTFVSVNTQPNTIKSVQDIEDKTTPIWLLLVVFYILIYPIRNILARAGYETYSSALGTPNLSGEKYVGTVILLVLSYATPNIVLLLIQFCTLISQYFMLNVMGFIEPSLNNVWLYLFMAIGEAILAVFFIVRPWVVCVVYAVCKLLAVWFLIGVWRNESSWIWTRFLKILTLQPVCVFVASICIMCIQWAGMSDATGAYLVMFVFLFYLCYKWTIGNFDLPARMARIAARRAL